MSFAESVINAKNDGVRLVVGKVNGFGVWYYVKLDPAKYREYKQALKKEVITISDYGEIIRSGWGDMPPDEVREEMEN